MSNKALTISEVLLSATDQIEQVLGAETEAGVDARFLLQHSLQKPYSYLLTWPEKVLSKAEADKFFTLVQRRLSGEPVAYITGHREFWTLDLKVTPDTLIPRSETELLVEIALNKLKNLGSKTFTDNPEKKPVSILDLGTGSGAIALALASEIKSAQVLATDFSASALNIARENAELNHISNILFLQSDWGKSIPEQQFNLIVSNPPYVAENDPHLQKGDLRFEPAGALWSDNNGFAAINQVIYYAGEHLHPGGWLVIEHGFEQAETVRQIMEKNNFHNISSSRDIAGHERITTACYEPGHNHKKLRCENVS